MQRRAIMPTPADILAGLTSIANQAIALAVLWHLALAALLIALAAHWRPTIRLATALLALPLASVAVLAIAFGNPFNGAIFALGAIVLAALALRGRERVGRRATVERGWPAVVGLALIAYAWVYPHFLEELPAAAYLIASPVGLVPCPSLAAAIGLALLLGGIDRPVAGLLAGLGAFYGVFGALRLGVWLDLGLIVGAAALAVRAIAWHGTPRARRGGMAAAGTHA